LAKVINMPIYPHIASSDEPSTRTVVQVPEGLPRKLVFEYLDDCRKDLSALNAAVIASDHERARVFGHQMKATGRPYGFPSLTGFGSAIEEAAMKKDTPELDRLFDRLEGYLSRVEIAGE
jgi:hypothetical protein